ncbi:MAG: hypothetical protein V7771_18760 [Shewanella psychromarinicola]|uniref:hypothetical protein n=1 Tax=Shewanella psychromarinicola TaxID=2487742 RepID=UPI003001E587
MKISFVYSILLLLVSLSSFSDLVPMTENDLSKSTGQSLVLIEEAIHTQPGGRGDYEFNRITLGLKIELNATIDEINLGTYYRGGGQNCSADGYFCDNNPTTYSKWNCSVKECGGRELGADGFNTLSVSPLIYGALFDSAGVDYNLLNVTFGALGLGDGAYVDNAEFDSTDGNAIFPSGFNYTPGTDLSLRDVTLGRIKEVNGQEVIEDFVFEDPFVEFAYNTTGEIVGLRTGFGIADGVQGNAINVFSGFVQPIVTASIQTSVGGAVFSFAPYLGGVRTPGYIDPNKSTLVGGCDGNFLLCPSVDTIGEVAHASPQAQLFPLQALVLDESPTMWLSLQSEDVDYPNEVVSRNGEEITYNYETAKAGVWFNLGALSIQIDGGAILVPGDDLNGNVSETNYIDFGSYTGLAVSTNQPLHPDNYFSLNTVNDAASKYPQLNNYY